MASGFEIAGVILGVLPLLIEGIKTYQVIAGKSTVKGFLRTLASLSRELQAEQSILENTYMGILYDIKAPITWAASGKVSIDLTEWKEGGTLGKKVERRLGRSAESFKNTAQSMDLTVKELMIKLGADQNGNIDTSCYSRMKLWWNDSEFEELIARLRRDNQRLNDLTRQSAELQPKSREAAQITLIRLASELLKNVYNALSASLRCACPEPHGVNLKLEAYPPELLKNGDEEHALHMILVHAILSYQSIGPQIQGTSWQWEEVAFRKSNAKPPHAAQTNALQLRQPKRLRKKQELEKSAQAMIAGVANLSAAIGKPSGDGVILNLCQAIRNVNGQQVADAYGHILDRTSHNECKLRVSSLRKTMANDWARFSLREVLLDKGNSLPKLKFGHKVRLAALIARGVIQIPSSSWLPEVVTGEHFVFIKQSSDTFYESAYVPNSMSVRTIAGQESSEPYKLPLNYTKEEKQLFSLGVVLMELVLGLAWDVIRASSSLTSDRAVAEEALSKVQHEGENYYIAIKNCVKFEFVEENAKMENPAFQQEVYSKVVKLLEDNLG